MTRTLLCTIPSPPVSYEIFLTLGLLHEKTLLYEHLSPFGHRFVIITDNIVGPLYGQFLQHALSTLGFESHLFSFPSGEKHKTRASKELLENQLFENQLSRDICIIALGGGVVTDLAGFLAATYSRGVPLVMIPTSLLAMVDASIGGKVGVNVPHGKNMIGCIYQPKKVLIDPLTLQTLPIRELQNGIVEMIKHALIADANFFKFLETHFKKLLVLDPEILHIAILQSCLIKKTIIEEDEKEHGKRRLLNFGHTIGHALETFSNYFISHGEAVALGLLIESHLSLQLGYLSLESFERIHTIMHLYDLNLKWPSNGSLDKLLPLMRLDKKSLKREARFVMIHDIGSALSFDAAYCTPVNETLIQEALNWITKELALC